MSAPGRAFMISFEHLDHAHQFNSLYIIKSGSEFAHHRASRPGDIAPCWRRGSPGLLHRGRAMAVVARRRHGHCGRRRSIINRDLTIVTIDITPRLFYGGMRAFHFSAFSTLPH